MLPCFKYPARAAYPCVVCAVLPKLQQGNEAILVGQVREQFRMNMQETDAAKVRSCGAAAVFCLATAALQR